MIPASNRQRQYQRTADPAPVPHPTGARAKQSRLIRSGPGRLINADQSVDTAKQSRLIQSGSGRRPNYVTRAGKITIVAPRQ
jgi:hypothetical protein